LSLEKGEKRMTIDNYGEAALEALLKAAEEWPHHIGIQAILAPVVQDYQRSKASIIDFRIPDLDERLSDITSVDQLRGMSRPVKSPSDLIS
jgi:hypothetical protein